MSLVEQKQQEWQNANRSMGENIQELSARISTTGGDLLKLQEILQDNIQELVGMIDVTGQEQLTFKEEIQKDVRAIDDSVGAITQKQSILQGQIEEVKDSADVMGNDLQTALEQLEDELYRSRILEQPETIEIESPEPSSLPSETNRIEWPEKNSEEIRKTLVIVD